MSNLLNRGVLMAALAVCGAGMGTSVQAQSFNPVCQKTFNGNSVCDVAKDVAQRTAAQLRPSMDLTAPVKPGEVMRYTEVSSVDNQVILKGRFLMDRDTYTRNVVANGKTLEQTRFDMEAAGRQSTCAPQSRPFIDAGGAMRMTVTFPDGSPFMDMLYDRC